MRPLPAAIDIAAACVTGVPMPNQGTQRRQVDELPAGLSLNPAIGAISGTPATAGSSARIYGSGAPTGRRPADRRDGGAGDHGHTLTHLLPTLTR